MLHSDAWTGAVDARHRFSGGTLEIAGSITGSHVRGDTLALQRTQRSAGHRFQRPDAAHVSYDPTATTLSGIGTTLRLRTLGTSRWRLVVDTWARSPGLEVGDLGFQHGNGADTWGGYADIGYRRLQPTAAFRRWSLSLNTHLNASFGGEVWERGGGLNFDTQFNNLWTLFLNVGGNLPTVSPEVLRGGPALRQPGRTGVYMELGTDPRRTLVARLTGNVNRQHEAGSVGGFLEPTLALRPSPRTSVSLAGTLQRRDDPSHYITRVTSPDGGIHVVGRLQQRLHAATVRVDYTVTPALSLQLWAQPFLAAGRFDVFREVANPRAIAFDRRYRTLTSAQTRRDAEDGRIEIDNDGDGLVDYRIANPDFALRELHSNVVLRWEYRPGSTAFLVWGHDRSAADRSNGFRVGDQLRTLLHTPAANRLLLKLSYRTRS
jgi:hypothetical protein